MKLSRISLTLALPALLAGLAAAQVAPITPLGRNPLAGLPTLLPSPLSGPLAGTPSTLPAPALTPALALPAPAPLAITVLPAAAAAPVAAPALPAVKIDGARENVGNPLRRVAPGVSVRFAAKGAAAPAAPKKEKLDETFDGSRAPSADDETVDTRRSPVDSARHVSLPEWDLESEIGIR